MNPPNMFCISETHVNTRFTGVKEIEQSKHSPISIDRRSITEIRNINLEIIKWNSQSEKSQRRPDQKRTVSESENR